MPESYVPTHAIMVPAFVGKQPRLYTIDIAFAPDRSDHQFLYQRRLIYRPGMTSPRTQQGVGAAGTGAVYLRDAMPRTWIRDLVRKVKAHDRGQMSPEFVADHLATLNYEVHQKIELHLAPDKKTVGPRCIVVWRRSMARLHRGGPKGGGGNMYYTGTTRDRGGAGIAIIGGGMDIRAIIDAIVQNPLHPNLSTVPVLPDEKLR